MDRAITRRDFLNGVAVAIGASIGYESEAGLNFWLDRAVEYAGSQPEKKAGK